MSSPTTFFHIVVASLFAVVVPIGCRDENLSPPSENRHSDGNGDTDVDEDSDTNTCDKGECLTDTAIVDTDIETDTDTCKGDACLTPTDAEASDTDTCKGDACLTPTDVEASDTDTCKGDACLTPTDAEASDTDTEPGDADTSFYINPLEPLMEDAHCDLAPTGMECNYYICTIGGAGMSFTPEQCTTIEAYCAAMIKCYADFTLCTKEVCPPGAEITSDFAADYEDCSAPFQLCVAAAIDAL